MFKKDSADRLGSESPDDASKTGRKDHKKKDDPDISDSVASSEDDSSHRRDRKDRGKKDGTKKGDRGRKSDTDKNARKQRKDSPAAATTSPAAATRAAEVKTNVNLTPGGGKGTAQREESRLPPATSFISTVMQWLGLTAWWVSGIAVHVTTIFLRLIMSLQKSALDGLTADHHVAFCFTFLYSFPFLVSYLAPWAPPWCARPAFIHMVASQTPAAPPDPTARWAPWLQGSGLSVVRIPDSAVLLTRAHKNGDSVKANLAGYVRHGGSLSPQLPARSQRCVCLIIKSCAMDCCLKSPPAHLTCRAADVLWCPVRCCLAHNCSQLGATGQGRSVSSSRFCSRH